MSRSDVVEALEIMLSRSVVAFGLVVSGATLVSAVGCNAQVATVLATSDGGAASSGAGDPREGLDVADEAASGTTTDNGGGVPPGDTVSARACAADQDCNDDPSMSSFAGRCIEKACICNAGFTVQPNGRCGVAPAPSCEAQGGTCTISAASPPACPDASDYRSEPTTCATSLCCVPSTSCKGSRTFRCCSAMTGVPENAPPICVNGWLTCAADRFAMPNDRPCLD